MNNYCSSSADAASSYSYGGRLPWEAELSLLNYISISMHINNNTQPKSLHCQSSCLCVWEAVYSEMHKTYSSEYLKTVYLSLSLSLVALHALSLSLVDSTQCVAGNIWRFSLCSLATSHMHCIHIMHRWYCSHNKDVLYLVEVENKVNSALWNWKLIVLRPCLVISRTHTCQEYFVHLSVPHILT